MQGSAFCFLPLPILTGLPVHVHACFQVTKNRRSLWAQAADLDGIHQSYANWNARLMGSALPALYTHVIETVAAPDVVTGRLSLDLFFGMWPNTSMVTATAGFQAAVPQLYQMLGAARVFPAATGEEAQPIQMLALGEIMALAHGSGGMEAGQRDGLLQLCQSARYRDCFPGRVVDLPIHVLDALGSHLGVKVRLIQDARCHLVDTCPESTAFRPLLAIVGHISGRNMPLTPQLFAVVRSPLVRACIVALMLAPHTAVVTVASSANHLVAHPSVNTAEDRMHFDICPGEAAVGHTICGRLHPIGHARCQCCLLLGTGH